MIFLALGERLLYKLEHWGFRLQHVLGKEGLMKDL